MQGNSETHRPHLCGRCSGTGLIGEEACAMCSGYGHVAEEVWNYCATHECNYLAKVGGCILCRMKKNEQARARRA